MRGVDAEYTDGQINHSAIFDHDDDAVAEGMFTQRMPLLRVGKVCLGKSPPSTSSTAINRGDEPPRLSHAMRDVKMRLIESTMSLLVVDEAEREDVSAVEQWVMMTPKNEAEDKISPIKMKMKHNPDTESPDPAPTPPTPSASSNVGDQSTPLARQECIDHTQSAQVSPDKFPGIASCLLIYACCSVDKVCAMELTLIWDTFNR